MNQLYNSFGSVSSFNSVPQPGSVRITQYPDGSRTYTQSPPPEVYRTYPQPTIVQPQPVVSAAPVVRDEVLDVQEKQVYIDKLTVVEKEVPITKLDIQVDVQNSKCAALCELCG